MYCYVLVYVHNYTYMFLVRGRSVEGVCVNEQAQHARHKEVGIAMCVCLISLIRHVGEYVHVYVHVCTCTYMYIHNIMYVYMYMYMYVHALVIHLIHSDSSAPTYSQ